MKFEDIMQLLKKLSVSTESQNKDSSSDSSSIGITTGTVINNNFRSVSGYVLKADFPKFDGTNLKP